MQEARYKVLYVLDDNKVCNPFGAIPFIYDTIGLDMWLPISWVFAEYLSNPTTFRTRDRNHPCTMSKLSTAYEPALADFIFTPQVLKVYRKKYRGKRRLYLMRLDTFIYTLCSPTYKSQLSYHPRYTLASRVSISKPLMDLLKKDHPQRARALRERLKRELQKEREQRQNVDVLAKVAALKDDILGKGPLA